MTDRRTYRTQFEAYLALAEGDGDLAKMHAVNLERRQLYATLAQIYYQMWKDAPPSVSNYHTVIK